MKTSLIAFGVLVLSGWTLGTELPQVASTDLDFRGSAPPLPAIYSCAHDLEGKQYSERLSNECLQRILASGYFLSGEVKAEPTETKTSVRVRMKLIAPNLKLVSVQYSLQEPDKSRLLAWLSRDSNFLSVGDSYDYSKEQLMIQRMHESIESRNRKIEISTKTILDYKSSTAQLQFSFYDAESGATNDSGEAFGGTTECKDEIEELNLTNIDDFVPIALVNRIIKTHAFSCFRDALIERDTTALLNTRLFKKVKFHVDGPQRARRIDLEIEGKPLTVNEIVVRTVGVDSGQESPSVSVLPLKQGSAYSRSAARRTTDMLATHFARSGKVVHVYQDVRQAGENTLTVEFPVVVFDEDSLIINGKGIDQPELKR